MKIVSCFAVLLISTYGYSQIDTKPATYNLDKLNLLNKPLIVLDGIKRGPDFDLKQIDPENIARIEVLKGDSAKFYYGEAGLNGVIILITKRPIFEEKVLAKNQPLFVLDGMKKDEKFDLKSINPNDIESINVLKDANATAAYGDAGKNGVIIISLKKGSIINPIRKIE